MKPKLEKITFQKSHHEATFELTSRKKFLACSGLNTGASLSLGLKCMISDKFINDLKKSIIGNSFYKLNKERI